MKTPLAGISDLIKSGCEIKSATQGGKKFTVLLQKETMAYAREFSSLTNSRCGAIN